MIEKELKYFDLLKNDVAYKFTAKYSASKDVLEWSGDTIALFQEDLLDETRGTVSEKWFYTYFKNKTTKLPRIDMLNLLSVYCGYNNWETYKYKHKEINPSLSKKNNFSKILISLFSITVVIILIFTFKVKKNNFEFCFIDDDKKEIISHTNLNIKILKKGESPIHLKTNNFGCFKYETEESSIRFIVSSPYYKTDTIVRNINNNYDDLISIQTDYHALMMNYLAKGKKQDWKKLRAELEDLIANDAKIYRVFPKSIDIVFYSKDEFINKLTLPTNDLKNIEILNKSYSKGKIIGLKFIIK